MVLEYLGKGTYGIIMKKTTENDTYAIKQFRIDYYKNESNTISNLDKEVEFTKLAYNINSDIFISIFKYEETENDIDLAKQIKINVPLIDSISNKFGYIYMEYMDCGDLYNFVRDNNNVNLNGILGCYLDALNILHNDLKIVHGDITPNNILVHYIGPNYRQRIIVNDESFFINTNGYCYKLCDFGIATHLENTRSNKYYINHIYRDFLLLFFIYFYKYKFNNYRQFAELIEIPVGYINDDFYNGYRETEHYKINLVDNYNYNSLCEFLDKCLEIDFNNRLIHKIPKLLLLDLVDIIFGCEI